MLWLILLALITYFVYIKFIIPLTYWKKQNVAYPKAWPGLGNMGPVLLGKQPIFEFIKELYFAFPEKRYIGFYQFSQPALLVRDIDLIKQITIKDFDHFTDHKQFVEDNEDQLIGKDIFSLKGQLWRDMRATLSPTFTSSKMKTMFSLVSECAQQFTQYFQNQKSDTTTVETKDIFNRFTTDVIATIAYGLKVNSLEDKNNQFFTMGKEATNFSDGLRGIRFMMFALNPSMMKYLKIPFFPKTITNFFRCIVTETIQIREREGIIRPDMIHLLMEAQKGRLKQDEMTNERMDSEFSVVQESSVEKAEKNLKPKLTDDDITAQAFLFFVAGLDTATSVLSFLSYELATHPEIQKKLQDEIDDTLENCNEKISYEILLKMQYLDMVISETLRKWPPGINLDRVCVKDYVIAPKSDDEKPLPIKKGDLILIPVVGIHNDPKYFPDPERFDPERFSDDNKRNIIPGSYLPFGIGPRNCIGSRLALLECKLLLVHLLRKFNFVVVEKTAIPLKLAPKPFSIQVKGGLWLGFEKRKK